MCLSEMNQRDPMMALDWCRAKPGAELSETNPEGTWAHTRLPGIGTVITLPDDELLFEMRLVEPWRS
jgi:hypothetical protein